MYDVVIVGGGPSGAAAGRLAGQKGLKTLLLEKEVFPRDKPCGGALSEHAISYLDFDIPDSLIEKHIFGARVHYRNQSIERQKPYRIATIVTRRNLDDYLLRMAEAGGAEVRKGEKAVDFTELSNHVEVRSERQCYQAKYLIIAEGAHGRLKNKIRRADTREEYALGIVTQVEKSNEYIDEYLHNAIEIHFGIAEMGYGWVFPHNGYFSVGVAGLASKFKNPRATMLDFLTARGFEGKYRLESHKIPAGGLRRNLTCSRALLVGDAAGFVDSFYGEGLAYAIRSGQLAAEAVSEEISGNPPATTIHDFVTACQNEFGNNLKYSLLLSRLMNRFPGIFFNVFTNNKQVLDNYLEVPARKRSYRSFITWLLPRLPLYLLGRSKV